jgi:hypothetical protein
MAPRDPSRLSRGGRYYRTNRRIEVQRKRLERIKLASAVYGFIEAQPEFAARWHPTYDGRQHVYHLRRKEEIDWRAFLRGHGWEVGEKGRTARISERLAGGRKPRPLPRLQELRRQRFHTEALGRSPESYRGIY